MILASLPPSNRVPDKAELRRELQARRATVTPDEARAAAAAATAAALARPEWAQARIVASYQAMRGELDPAPLEAALGARGVTIVWPRVADDVRRGLLTFHRADAATLRPGAFGVAEPPADAPLVALADIDVFVVPGLAFSRAGARLGWGRGHYDVTLAAAPRALRLAWAFAFQLVPAVPESSGDERVDVIVTEGGALDTGARALDVSWRNR